MSDKKSIVTSAGPASGDDITIPKGPKPPRTHSGEWVLPPSGIPGATVDDVIDDLPKSMREVLELIRFEQREWFRRNPAEAARIRNSPEFVEYLERLSERAAAVPEGHWAHGRPLHVYVGLLGDAYVWARLIE